MQRTHRIFRDIEKLTKSEEYKVYMLNKENFYTLCVSMKGPAGSYYEDVVLLLKLAIPKEYPFKSPKIGFLNRIYHPKIDLENGKICIDNLNELWKPSYNLNTICDTIIPEFLRSLGDYESVNLEAAQLCTDANFQEYIEKVHTNAEKYTTDPDVLMYLRRS